MNDRPIGVFDSGMGGFTVMRKIIDRLPRESIIYLGDNARGPFGPRSPEEIRGFALQIASYLEKLGVKLIVIACNSASAAALLDVQRACRVPVIGVIEPGARGAVMATDNRRIGVIGTEVTVRSRAYRRAILALDAGAHVYARACPTLVDRVERGEVEGPQVEKEIRDYLRPLLGRSIDTLILGCTHYPLLLPLIARVAGEKIALINSAEEVAREVEEKLRRRDQLRISAAPPLYRFLFTGDVEQARRLGGVFLGPELREVEQVELR